MVCGTEQSTQCRRRPVRGEKRIDSRYLRPRTQTIDFGQALVANEEKCLISYDGATNRSSKLIVLQLRSGLSSLLQEEVIRIEDVVAYKLPGAAVEPIGAALAHHIDI